MTTDNNRITNFETGWDQATVKLGIAVAIANILVNILSIKIFTLA